MTSPWSAYLFLLSTFSSFSFNEMETSRDTKERVCVGFKKIGIAKFSCGRNINKRLLFLYKFHVGFHPYSFHSLLASQETFNLFPLSGPQRLELLVQNNGNCGAPLCFRLI
jgi:hypothetical protein